jgi:hypothetical protein
MFPDPMFPETRTDRWLALVKNNPVSAVLIVLGLVVIGVARFSGAVDSLMERFSGAGLGPERTEYCELLEPMIVQLDRTKAAFDRWNSQNLPLESQIIYEGNKAIKELLLEKASLVPAELKDDARKLVEHYDRWFEEYEKLRGGPAPDLDAPFVFVGPEGYPFPTLSAQRFRKRHGHLAEQLGESPCY